MVLSLTPQLVTGFFIGISLCIGILFAFFIHAEVRINRLTRGKNGASLEDTIALIKKELNDEQRFKREMEHYLTNVEKRLSTSIRTVETLRFNAFRGTGSGGNQSFATAYVNEKGDGVIVSSLNAHDRVSVFAKPVKQWKSELELTPEEKEVLETVRKSITA